MLRALSELLWLALVLARCRRIGPLRSLGRCRLLFDGVLVLTGAVLAATSVFPVYRVSSRSMQPTLQPGDRVIADRLAYVWRRPVTGELTVFVFRGRVLVKRIAAVAGERTADGRVVPPGHVYVLGDNAAHSLDSRRFGPVPVNDLIGPLCWRLYPWQRVGSLL